MMAFMEPPGITRHRRPFLAPLWLTFLAVLVVAGAAWMLYRSATTTVVFLVRPPEKEPGSIADPPLSSEGEARAQRLADMFAMVPGGLEAVYVSDDRRAQQTAAPLVERLHHGPSVFKSGDAAAVAARALREHGGGTVLVIADTAAAAQILRGLIGRQPAAAGADEADAVYIISVPTLGRAHLARIKF
jgi:2,3-bisphosphoglycerate-dependent phosphoglycerate mutase